MHSRKGKTDQMKKVDPKLLEMAEVFHIPKKARLKYIILPAIMPGLSKLIRGKSTAGFPTDQARGGPGKGERR